MPPPYGGKYRQIMVYVDPLKLQAHQLSPMDVVRATDESNLILPAGDVRIGPMDYNIYTNAQVPSAKALNDIPLKTEGEKSVFVSDVGKAVDGSALQYNIVRVNGQKSVYVPILKQGGDTNTIAVVDGIRKAIQTLRDIPAELKTHVVFDQSVFVKQAISTVLREGGIGLVLTAVMILLFLGSAARHGGCISFDSAFGDGGAFPAASWERTINSMVLSGLALAFSRLIDNSVVVLENVFRHIEIGETPRGGGRTRRERSGLGGAGDHAGTVVVFFPVTLLFGVSKYSVHGAGAGRGDLACSLPTSSRCPWCRCIAPTFCARIVHTGGRVHGRSGNRSWVSADSTAGSTRDSNACWTSTTAGCRRRSTGRGSWCSGFLESSF